jgi:hypothetical protein
MIKKLLLYNFCVVSIFTNAQSIERSAISSGFGIGNASSTVQLQSIVAEVFSTTLITTDNLLTQGFLQPEPLLSTNVKENANQTSQFNLSPNPCSDLISITSKYLNTLGGFLIYDSFGRTIFTKKNIANTISTTSIEISTIALESGCYFIKFLDSKNEFLQVIKFTKI